LLGDGPDSRARRFGFSACYSNILTDGAGAQRICTSPRRRASVKARRSGSSHSVPGLCVLDEHTGRKQQIAKVGPNFCRLAGSLARVTRPRREVSPELSSPGDSGEATVGLMRSIIPRRWLAKLRANSAITGPAGCERGRCGQCTAMQGTQPGTDWVKRKRIQPKRACEVASEFSIHGHGHFTFNAARPTAPSAVPAPP